MFKPDNIPQLSPYLTVSDSAKSIDFYRDAFGFALENAAKDDNRIPQHVEMKKQEAFIMFSPEGAYESTKKTPNNLGITIPVNMYLYCEDTDALYKQALEYGARSIMEPQDSFWGDRFCMVEDLDGYQWGFATRLKV